MKVENKIRARGATINALKEEIEGLNKFRKLQAGKIQKLQAENAELRCQIAAKLNEMADYLESKDGVCTWRWIREDDYHIGCKAWYITIPDLSALNRCPYCGKSIKEVRQ